MAKLYQWHVIAYILNEITEDWESVPAREIFAHPIMQRWYVVSKSDAKGRSLVNMVDRRLQERTSPDSTTVGSKRKLKPYLFDKTTDSKWYLTQRGRSFVNDEIIPTFGEQIISDFGDLGGGTMAEKVKETLPNSHEEARRQVLRVVNERRGQYKFRKSLLDAYNHQCAITKSNATEALEAAHIKPFGGGGSMEVSNGLLLRADIHTLFDLNYLTIDPESRKVELAEALQDTDYSYLHGREIKPTDSRDNEPSKEALIWHNEFSKKTRLYL